MIDHTALNEAIATYKDSFATDIWPQAKHKWRAVKQFQDHWQLDAPGFADMLRRALARAGSLLASGNGNSRAVIEELAREQPEQVRAMFAALFDENADLDERIATFSAQADRLAALQEAVGNRHQDATAITTYLWLRFPDQHYVYNYAVCRTVAGALGTDYRFIRGHDADNLRAHQAMYNEIRGALASDAELRSLVDNQLAPDCYSDPSLTALTIDFALRIGHDDGDEPNAWWPRSREYHPGLGVQDWVRLLGDSSVFTPGSLQVMKRMKDSGGQASCVGLAHNYGRTSGFYNGTSSSLGERVAKATGCPTLPHTKAGGPKWWPILYKGRDATKSEDGTFIWRLRDELSTALDQVDLSDVPLYVDDAEIDSGATVMEQQNYWLLVASPSQSFTFDGLAVGETEDWTVLNPSGAPRRIARNLADAKDGDHVIGYESAPAKQIAALGRIAPPPDEDHLRFLKEEGLAAPVPYEVFEKVPELKDMEAFANNMRGTLFKLTASEYQVLLDLIRETNPEPDKPHRSPYTRTDFLAEVFMSGEHYDRLAGVLRRKKNIILQGAPGVGKTFAAERLAWSVMGEKDNSRVQLVQFHQSYSYEDFVMGYKPTEEGFSLQDGVFYRFCARAADHPVQDFFFIIDEINRGNISRIFGELLMLIEADYRGKPITMACGGRTLAVPPNVYLIGMMNTADRSLAVIDYALRRRFSFFTMTPGFVTEGFKEYQSRLASKHLDQLVRAVQVLNAHIAADPSLGGGFAIGHSYLCGQSTVSARWLRDVVDFDILPMLEEYWFDDPDKVEAWRSQLYGALEQ